MTPEVIGLREYQTRQLERDELGDEFGEVLWRQYGSQVSIEFPSPKTDWKWQLQPLGFVGYIPLDRGFGVSIQPRVEIGNLFRMLEYAYRLKVRFFDDLTGLESLAEFYERLAAILAKRTLDRARRGLYREYIPKSESLPYVRGSLDLTRRLSRPWEVRLHCDYQEHTADVEENQILAWTLMKVARSGACTERALPAVRRAYRAAQGAASLKPFAPEACVDRLYNRLNEDYQPLHALCRFFLEHTGPALQSGEHRMLPFLLSMPRLFELFVAEWLKVHLPPSLGIKIQEKVKIGDDHGLKFEIDLVLYDAFTGRALCVLDTKYKIDERPQEQGMFTR